MKAEKMNRERLSHLGECNWQIRVSCRMTMKYLPLLIAAVFGYVPITSAATVHTGTLATSYSSLVGNPTVNASNSVTIDLSNLDGLTTGQPIWIEFTPDSSLLWFGAFGSGAGSLDLLWKASVQITVGNESFGYTDEWSLGPIPFDGIGSPPYSNIASWSNGPNPTTRLFTVPWATDLSAVTLTLTDQSSIVAPNGYLADSAMNLQGATFTTTTAAAPTKGETEYPILEPTFAYAHTRHAGEARVGSVGTTNKLPNSSLATLTPTWTSVGGQSRDVLSFNYEFRDSDSEEFAGLFLTFGRIAVDTVLSDGTKGPALDLHSDGTFNLDNLASTGNSPLSIESLRFRLRQNTPYQALTIRVELEDKNKRKGILRFLFSPSNSAPATLDIPLTDFGGSFDRTAVKLLAMVIEENNYSDNIHNPQSGNFDVLGISLVDKDGVAADAASIAQLENTSFVRALASRDFESLWRMSDTKTGATLDRSLYRDLIHWGSTGWLLAALPFAVQEGWISKDEAEARALRILRFVDDPNLFGDEPVGRLGNSRGVFYRFGGIDPTGLSGHLTGTRKIDIGNVNAVEASVIDTALFQLGAATCAAGFSNATATQIEIRSHVTNILNRTRWNDLVDATTGQLYMAWKPEFQAANGVYFTAPAAFGGYWASRDAVGTPLTIDYWTAEGAMAALLAVGSETYPVSAAVWYSMFRQSRQVGGQSVVVTFPGAWFTYAFVPTIYLDPTLGQDRGAEYGVTATDWVVNTRRAFDGYRALNPSRLSLPDATELPNIQYAAQGIPALAVDTQARFSGSFTPYSLQMAIGLGGTTADTAIAELKQILGEIPQIWDPLVGLLDSFHTNLAEFTPQTDLARMTGPWVQQQKWPLDCGAALLAQLNYIDNGVVWRTANQHPVIATAVDRIYRQQRANVNRIVTLGTPGGHDWWGTAISGNTVIFADGFQEVIHFYDANGAYQGQTNFNDIGAALDTASISVERSSGPAGLRDAAVLPDGNFVVIVAGPGNDTLLRVSTNRTVSVLAHAFGDAMNRGDEIWNFPRVAVGGVPSSILVTIQAPVQGVAVVGLNGTLLRQLNLGALYYGLAVEPATNHLYLLRSDGAVQRYEDLTVTGLTPTTVAMLPTGVIGRDLAWTALWRTDRPTLVVSADNGRLYTIDLTTSNVALINDDNLTGVVGLDIAGRTTILARDETGLLNEFVIPLPTLCLTLDGNPATDIILHFTGAPGAYVDVETSTNLSTWEFAGRMNLGISTTEFRHTPGANPKMFYRARYNH